jgi:hypothetical protein
MGVVIAGFSNATTNALSIEAQSVHKQPGHIVLITNTISTQQFVLVV